MLAVRRTIREQYVTLHKRMMLLAKADDVCRVLMTAPGVGPFVALTYRAAIDEPARFRRSRAVGAHVGLAPRTHQSGELDRRGSISKGGDGLVRAAPFESAGVLLRSTARFSPLKTWGMAIAKRRGIARAMTAVARKLTVVLHRMWVDGTPSDGPQSPPEPPSSHIRLKAAQRPPGDRWIGEIDAGQKALRHFAKKLGPPSFGSDHEAASVLTSKRSQRPGGTMQTSEQSQPELDS